MAYRLFIWLAVNTAVRILVVGGMERQNWGSSLPHPKNQPFIRRNVSISQSISACLDALFFRDTPPPNQPQIRDILLPITNPLLSVRLQVVVVCLSSYFRHDFVSNACGVADNWECLFQALKRWGPFIGRKDLQVLALAQSIW